MTGLRDLATKTLNFACAGPPRSPRLRVIIKLQLVEKVYEYRVILSNNLLSERLSTR